MTREKDPKRNRNGWKEQRRQKRRAKVKRHAFETGGVFQGASVQDYAPRDPRDK